jgi:hypothetical protein
MRFMLMGKKWKTCVKQKRYEGVSKALDMLGHATYQICPIFSQMKRYFLTHIYIKDASLKVGLINENLEIWK